jgi:signal transduction histidine kinase
VANEGSIIDPSVRSELFEPLKRGVVKTDSPEARDGLGLGLFIVREIARAHGGTVEVRCDRDAEETIFAVSLPRQKPVSSG